MRVAIAALFALIAASAIQPQPAHADPYRWCADYQRGGTNCYFVTFSQCRAAISGIGGFCRENGFYDGRPVTTPEDEYDYPRRRFRR